VGRVLCWLGWVRGLSGVYEAGEGLVEAVGGDGGCSP
jgi:hypothetical protein